MKRGKPMKRTPLNYRSKKRQDMYVDRRSIVKDMLSSNPVCEACRLWTAFDLHSGAAVSPVFTSRRTKDVHELVNRSQGGSILDMRNLFPVCRPCHNRITTEPKDAELLGLHLDSWCNTEEGFKEAERLRREWARGNPSKPYWIE